MTAQVEKTLVLSFGETVVAAGGSIIAAFDDSKNVDKKGEVKSQWLPGEPVWFLTQNDATVRITRALATAGEIQAQGETTTSRTDELGFGSADDEQSLSWIPNGGVSPTWYGRQGSGLKVSGRTITVAAGHPCLAKMSYSARVRRYMLQTPTMTLAKGQTFPWRIYIYYVEVG